MYYFLALLLLLVLVSIFELILLINKNRELRNAEVTRQILYETVEKISKTDNEDEIYSAFLKTIVALIPGATKGSILLKGDKDIFYYKEILGYQEELKAFTLKEEIHSIMKTATLEKMDGITVGFSYGIYQARPDCNISFDKAIAIAIADDNMYQQKKKKKKKTLTSSYKSTD